MSSSFPKNGEQASDLLQPDQQIDFFVGRMAMLESAVTDQEISGELSLTIAQAIGELATACRDAQERAGTMSARQQAMVINHRQACREPTYIDPERAQVDTHKLTVKEQLSRFMDAPPNADGGRRGYLDIGSAGGKTVMSIFFMNACGIGSRPSPEEAPLAALLLAPDTLTVADTAKRASGLQGYTHFIPDMPTNTGSLDEGKPITMMTYRAFVNLPDETMQRLANTIDLVVLDKVHQALGPQCSARLREFMPGKTVLGLTTEPGQKYIKGIQTVLGLTHEIARATPRELIEDGVANGVQVLLFSSGQTIHINSRRGEMTTADLRPIRENPSRDNLILDSIQYMAERGRTGIVKAIKGGEAAAHARTLAEKASLRHIIDPGSGEERALRVKAIGTFLPLGERQRRLREFEYGELDALAFTTYLQANIASDRVEYVCDAAPGLSVKNAHELFGRGMFPKDRLTIYMQFLDRLSGTRGGKVYTFLDVLGEQQVTPGFTLGQPAGRKSQVTEKNVAAVDSASAPPGRKRDTAGNAEVSRLPASLLQASEELAGELLAHLTVIPVTYETPPENWVRLDSLTINKEVSRPTLEKILSELGIPFKKAKMPGGIAIYGPPDTEERLAGYKLLEVADQEVVPFTKIRERHSISQDVIHQGVAELDLHIEERRSDKFNKKRSLTLRALDYVRFAAWLKNTYPPLDPGQDVWITSLVRELGRARVHINTYLAERGIKPHERYTETHYRRVCVTKEVAAQIRRDLGKDETSSLKSNELPFSDLGEMHSPAKGP